jgi:sugar phosphate isomerase/epimerase
MTAPIALQLYSIREALAQDFEGSIRQVAEMGYVGVEVAGFPGTTPEAAAKLFASLGLTVCGAHSRLPVTNEILDALDTLGSDYLVISWMDPSQYFSSVDQIKQAAGLLAEGYAIASQRGVKLAYHNHDFEFVQVDGRIAHEILRERVPPEVLFELDVYWIQVAGLDPIQTVREVGSRAPLLHIKDGPVRRGEPMTAVGSGVVDIPAIIQASAGHAEWLIVELDACATDMMTAVKESYDYLVGSGLAQGRI